jgi:hypothetical protein
MVLKAYCAFFVHCGQTGKDPKKLLRIIPLFANLTKFLYLTRPWICFPVLSLKVGSREEKGGGKTEKERRKICRM